MTSPENLESPTENVDDVKEYSIMPINENHFVLARFEIYGSHAQ